MLFHTLFHMFHSLFNKCVQIGPHIQGVVDSSTDVDLLWTEIKAARDILTHIQSMRQGRFQDVPVTVQSEVIIQFRITVKYLINKV